MNSAGQSLLRVRRICEDNGEISLSAHSYEVSCPFPGRPMTIQVTRSGKGDCRETEGESSNPFSLACKDLVDRARPGPAWNVHKRPF